MAQWFHREGSIQQHGRTLRGGGGQGEGWEVAATTPDIIIFKKI